MNRRELLLSSLGIAVLPLGSAFGQGKAQKWALLIGVDAYLDRNIAPLSGAANDALALQKALIEKLSFPAEHIRALTSASESKPSRTEILDGLAWLVRNAQAGDMVVVAYSGHGIEIDGTSYLLPYDTSAADDSTIVDTALETSKFQQRLRGVKASVRLYLFDMCRTDPRRAKDAVAPDNKLSAGLKKGLDFSGAGGEKPSDGSAPPAIVTLMACSEGERSWEWRDKKRGFFSYFVEQGLNGEAADETGTVTLASLKDYVGREVPKAVKGLLGQTQTPLPSVTGNDQVALLKGVAGKANQKLKATTARLAFSGLPDGAVVSVEGSSVTGEYREDMSDKTKSVSVSVSAPGYKPYSGSVEIRRGELVTAPIALVAIPLARLIFPDLPSGAILKIDGKVVDAKVEYREELDSATKSVELSVSGLAGYKPYVSDVELKRGGLVKAEIALEKKTPDPMPKKEPEPMKEPDPNPGPKRPVNPVSKATFAAASVKIRGQYPEIAAYLDEMCFVPGGTFDCGAPKKQETVTDFYLGATPVTVGMWKEYCKASGVSMPTLPYSEHLSLTVWKGGWDRVLGHPIVDVSPLDCEAFCKWLSGVSGVEIGLPTCIGFEYAAREGGKKREYPWGDTLEDRYLWYSKTSKQQGTAPVKRNKNIYRNSLGLSDMSGNVWQWCSDGYESPVDEYNRYKKGASWYDSDNYGDSRCNRRTVGSRNRMSPADRGGNNGFRLCAGQ